jgi:hypothetical protein
MTDSAAHPTTVINVSRLTREQRAARVADPNFVYVGRQFAGWPGSIWGNPFKAGMDPFAAMRIMDRLVQTGNARKDAVLVIDGPFTVMDAVAWYREYVQTDRRLWEKVGELRGKTLGCWCCDWRGVGEPARPCHAVELARIADSAEPDE